MLERNQISLEKNEVEIEYKWLLNAFRHNLKFIVIMAIVMSILLPSIKIFVDSKSFEKLNGEAESVLLTEEELLLVDEFKRVHERALYLESYGEESLLMNLDYKNVCCATVQYYVSGDASYVNDVTNALVYYVSTGAYATKLSVLMNGIESRQLLDIMSVKTLDDSNMNQSNIICMEIFYTSKEECKVVVDKLTEVLSTYLETLSGPIGENSLVLLSVNYDNLYSESIYAKQSTIKGMIQSIKSEQNTLLTQLTDEQKKYLLQEDKYKDVITDSDIIIDNDAGTIGANIDFKYVILGSIIGGGLAIVLIFIKALFDGAIHSENELNKRFGINKWGIIKNGLSEDSEHDFSIVERLKVYLKNKNIKNLLIIGTDMVIIEKISKELINSNIKATCVDLRSMGTKSVEELAECNNAIVVASVGKDKVKQFYLMDDIIHCLDVELHGYIAIKYKK